MGTKIGALKAKCIKMEAYKSKLFQKLSQNNHVLLGDYLNSQTVTTFKCNNHNLIFKVKPTKYLNRNQGCPLCSRTNSNNKETNLQKLKQYCENNNLILLSAEYKDSKSKLDLQCKKCSFSFQKTSSNLYKQGCPKCSNRIQNKTVLYKDLKSLIEKEDYILLEDRYVKAHAPINIQCKRGHYYTGTATGFKSGKRCPICANEKHPGVINFGTIKKQSKYLTNLCYLYFLEIKVEDNVFYKIGISNNIATRIKRLVNEIHNSKIKVLYNIETTYYRAFLIEQYILIFFNYFKYVYTIKFQGYTECFNLGIDLFLVSLFFKNADALFLNSETESELLEYLQDKQTTK